jgi:TetR/AcrR family transcriptional repressor of nem operon
MVGRPRQFDPENALEAAMRAFWANGYTATSVVSLTAAMGMHKGSIYQAFGSKHALFIQSLKRYLVKMRRRTNVALLAAPTQLDALRSFAHAVVEMANDDVKCPTGCIAVNSLVELAPHDQKVLNMLTNHSDSIVKSMTETITAAQRDCDIRSDRPANVLALLVLTFIQGLGANLRGTLKKTEAHQLLDVHMDLLF